MALDRAIIYLLTFLLWFFGNFYPSLWLPSVNRTLLLAVLQRKEKPSLWKRSYFTESCFMIFPLCKAKVSDRHFQTYLKLLLNCLNLSFLVMQSLCINFITDGYHLSLILSLFKSIIYKRHSYNTRSASNMFYTLPKVKTNYGIFNIRFKGPKVWNSISENLKTISISNFKESVKREHEKKLTSTI